MNSIKLTREMFEASKILAPAIVRGRASLFFDGYGIRKYLQISGHMNAGKSPAMWIKVEIEFHKTVYQFPLSEYLSLEWSEVQELLVDLEPEPTWITLQPGEG